MLGIVIEGVAAGDALDHQPGSFVQCRSYLRLPLTVDPAVGFGQVAAERIRQKARWISTWLSPKARVPKLPCSLGHTLTPRLFCRLIPSKRPDEEKPPS